MEANDQIRVPAVLSLTATLLHITFWPKDLNRGLRRGMEINISYFGRCQTGHSLRYDCNVMAVRLRYDMVGVSQTGRDPLKRYIVCLMGEKIKDGR
jgi:hypothetical protein